jgi:hypothetical protein
VKTNLRQQKNGLIEKRKQKTILAEPQNIIAQKNHRDLIIELIYKGITCKEMLRKQRSD